MKKQHSDRTDSANRRLLITTVLCGFFLITELVGGYISNSLSIMTDAAHLLSDIVSFGLSLFAVYLSKKRATKRFTFGYQRAEILGAICKSFFQQQQKIIIKKINKKINDQIFNLKFTFTNLLSFFYNNRFNSVDLGIDRRCGLLCNYAYYNYGFRNRVHRNDDRRSVRYCG